jgi:hypothetical protein
MRFVSFEKITEMPEPPISVAGYAVDAGWVLPRVGVHNKKKDALSGP